MLKNAAKIAKNFGEKARSRSGSREKILKDSAVQASPSARETAQVVKAVVIPAKTGSNVASTTADMCH